MLIFAIFLTALLYMIAAATQYRQLTTKSTSLATPKNTTRLIKSTAAIAIAAHTLILQFTLHLPEGINLSFFTAGSLISWLVALVLLISSTRQKVDNLFIAVFPMAALLLILEGLLSSPEAKPYAAGVIGHILLSILAYSIFTLAAFQALLLQRQNAALKHGASSRFLNSLPPLQTMERLLFEMLWTGFILLSAALITGFAFVENIFAQHLAHKSVLSILAWSIFAVLLSGRIFWGWRGHKATRWTIGGFIILMAGFFGSKLVLEILL